MLLLAPWARIRTPSMVVLRGTPRVTWMVRSGPTGNVMGTKSPYLPFTAPEKNQFLYRERVYPFFFINSST